MKWNNNIHSSGDMYFCFYFLRRPYCRQLSSVVISSTNHNSKINANSHFQFSKIKPKLQNSNEKNQSQHQSTAPFLKRNVKKVKQWIASRKTTPKATTSKKSSNPSTITSLLKSTSSNRNANNNNNNNNNSNNVGVVGVGANNQSFLQLFNSGTPIKANNNTLNSNASSNPRMSKTSWFDNILPSQNSNSQQQKEEEEDEEVQKMKMMYGDGSSNSLIDEEIRIQTAFRKKKNIFLPQEDQ